MFLRKKSIENVKSDLEKLEGKLDVFLDDKNLKKKQIIQLKKILVKISEDEKHLDSIEEHNFVHAIKEIENYIDRINKEIVIIVENSQFSKTDSQKIKEEKQKFKALIWELKRLLKNQVSMTSKVISLLKQGLPYVLIIKLLFGTAAYANTNKNSTPSTKTEPAKVMTLQEMNAKAFLDRVVCIHSMEHTQTHMLTFFIPPVTIPKNQTWYIQINGENRTLGNEKIQSSRDISRFYFGREGMEIDVIKLIIHENGKIVLSSEIPINKSRREVLKKLKAKREVEPVFPQWPKNKIFTWESSEHIQLRRIFERRLKKINEDYKNSMENEHNLILQNFIDYMKKIVEFYFNLKEKHPTVNAMNLASELEIYKEYTQDIVAELVKYEGGISANIYEIDEDTNPKDTIKAAVNTMLQGKVDDESEILQNYHVRQAVIKLMREIPIDAKDWRVRMNNIAPMLGNFGSFDQFGDEVLTLFEQLKAEREKRGLSTEMEVQRGDDN